MKAYLLLDFGSTYTKLTAVDIENEEILATARALTTVSSDIMEGYREAEAELLRQLGGKPIRFVRKLACSSAAGGLKMIAVGLAKNLTTEAAKRSALGAGARLLKTYSYELSREDIAEMESLRPDIILLSVGTERNAGIGNVVVADVGGATTDIHSIGTGLPEDGEVRYEVLKEPFAKRTVEGDLGMRYSALSLYEAVGEAELKSYLRGERDIREECRRRSVHVEMTPVSEADVEFDEAMAAVAVRHAMDRHAGNLRKQFTQTRHIYYQEGKDLRKWNALIGTGGVLVHSRNPKRILQAGCYREEEPELLKPLAPELLLDQNYVLSAMGLLASELPDTALAIMKKNLMRL